jgi:hypothetical protein
MGAGPVDASVDRPASAARRWRRWVDTEHLGLSITLAYLFLAGLGMLHRVLVLRKFGINVLDYAEPSDFLLAAFRDPLIVLACIAPIPVVWLYYRGAQWIGKRVPQHHWVHGGARGQEWYGRHRSALFSLTIGLWALAASLTYANSVATDLRAGKGRRVQADVVSGTLPAADDTAGLLLLGTTQKFVFLYDDARQVTSVVPVDNVAQLRYRRPPWRREPASATR